MTGDLRAFVTRPDGPVIFGRESELIALSRLLAELQAGQGGKVLLTGEAGIGKSTLVRRMVSLASERGVCVLSGTCYELDVQAPYALWRDLFDEQRIAATLNSHSQSVDGLRSMVLEDVAAIGGDRPVMLILEDIHWADEPSLDLLRFIIHRSEVNQLLLLVTCRDEVQQPSQPVYRFLPQFVREARPLRLALRPLSRAAVAEFIRLRYPNLPADDVDRLLEFLGHYGEGNPLFVEELAGMLEYQQVLQQSPSGWTLGELPLFPVPPLVRQIIDARLLRLDSASLGQLERASILGVEVPIDHWQAISGASSAVLEAAIDAAVAEQILVELPSGLGFRFRHALIHGVVYDRLNTLHRRELHRTAAEMLANRADVEPAVVAHHFSLAADIRAAGWLIRAGRSAGRSFALHDAAENYERALEILERAGDVSSDRTWLLCALAEAHRYTNTDLSLVYVNRAFESLETLDDPAMRVLAIWCRARIRGFLHENVVEDLLSASREYDALSNEEKARILNTPLRYVVSRATLAQDLANYGQYEASRDMALAFLQEHEREPSAAAPIEAGNALFGLGMALAALGDPGRARDAFERSRASFLRTDNYQMLSISLYWELSFVAQVYDAENPDVRRQLRQAEVDSNRKSELARAAALSEPISTSETMILDGEWEHCRRMAAARLAVPASRIPSIRKLAHLDWLQGYDKHAAEMVQMAFPNGPDEAPGKRMFLHRHEIQWIAAELALDRQDLDLARRWISSIEQWQAWSKKVTGRYVPRLLRSRLNELAGEPAAAIGHAEAALALARTPRQPLGIIAAQRAVARLLVHSGHHGRAATPLAEALDIARTSQAPHEIAATLVVQAEMLHASGLVGDAGSVLAEARAIAEYLGARPLLQEIETLTSRRSAVRNAPAFFGLSRREMEVLGYVAEGYTDAQIADELSISPRTVGGHLQSILNKTGTNSRTAATALAYKHGALDSHG